MGPSRGTAGCAFLVAVDETACLTCGRTAGLDCDENGPAFFFPFLTGGGGGADGADGGDGVLRLV